MKVESLPAGATPLCGSRKHHYVPLFYLKEWTGADGRLCEYSRPYKKVCARRVHPAATGYEIDLYTVHELPPAERNYMEDIFFKKFDQLACDAFRLLKRSEIASLTAEMRSAWSRFIMGSINRHPEKVAWVKAQMEIEIEAMMPKVERDYDTLRGPTDPPTFAEFWEKFKDGGASRTSAAALRQIVELENVGTFINQMRWNVVTIAGLEHPLLTSDRPVIMTNGIKHDHSHIVVPLGPTQLFVAVTQPQTEQSLRDMGPRDLARRANDRVASQAKRYVYGVDDKQLRFVENRLGRGEAQFIAGKPVRSDRIAAPSLKSGAR